MSIFTAAANAAITAVPKLLTSPCTIRIPKFMIDCCMDVSRDRLRILFKISLRKCLCPRPNRRMGTFFHAYIQMPSPDTYCAITVAAAAPEIPKLKTATNRTSNATFRTADTPRNSSGIMEFPTARRLFAK